MMVALETSDFLLGIEYVAIFCCAMVGGLSAVRKGYDITAILITAWLTALGGGIIRDVMLQVTPVGVSDKGLVFTALASGIAVALFHPEVDKLKAMGLGASGMTAAFMGLSTALGGGLIRDTLINEVPMIIRDRHWYFVPAAVACVATVFVCKADIAGWIDLQQEIALDLAIVALAVAMRLLSVRFNIGVPGAIKRHTVYLPSETKYPKRQNASSQSSAQEDSQQLHKC